MGEETQANPADDDGVESETILRSASSVRYQRIRAPQEHGESLQVPDLVEASKLWSANRGNVGASAGLKIGGMTLGDLRRLGRAELVSAALEYSQSYLDVAIEPNSGVDGIVMAGHQPELFHPGVWYKNFVLSELGARFNCLAINLVVDNDIAGNDSIRFPTVRAGGVSGKASLIDVAIGSEAFDKPGPDVPLETRELQDWGTFESFGKRVAESVADWVESPIVNKLWPHVLNVAGRVSGESSRLRLGAAIAAGRHRYEHEFGLRTLEVPVSRIASTEAFAQFTKVVIDDALRFREFHNQVLFEYRAVHGIRSTSHPVPELDVTDEGWVEVPFWVWHVESTGRKRLFVKNEAEHVRLTDREDWEIEIPTVSLAEALQGLMSQGVAIRPKALMTTMFSRLVLCDLFLHGLGGAKYDELTDVIAARFFAVELPRYFTLTATLKLPTELELVSRRDVVAIERKMRELEFHPERLLTRTTPECDSLVAEKRVWTDGDHCQPRSRERHLAIESLNTQLAEHVGLDQAQLAAEREAMLAKIRGSEILGSREFSFCLFPESLIGELKDLAKA